MTELRPQELGTVNGGIAPLVVVALIVAAGLAGAATAANECGK